MAPPSPEGGAGAVDDAVGQLFGGYGVLVAQGSSGGELGQAGAVCPSRGLVRVRSPARSQFPLRS